MDSNVPMVLPKGIVINTSTVYKEVAAFSVVPSDKVWQYWNVYTTTYRRLKDPTACRLENFWWHVWGSNRKSLKGSTLAKLYEDISIGSTVVPLKGPPNRWEGPDTKPEVKRPVEMSQPTPPPPPPAPKPRQSSTSTNSGLRVLSSSASKPPPAHPILKKSRGSSSGPRPTARFVSPPQSDNEDEIPSSGSTAATASEVPVYVTPSPRRKSTSSTKKFIASKATKKRRPSLPKRQSSDHRSREPGSSNGLQYVAQRSVTPILEHNSEQIPDRRKSADSGSRESASSNGLLDVAHRLATSIPEHHSEQISSASDNAVSLNSQSPPVMSEKARGKQPAIPRRPISQLNGLAKHPTFAASQPEQLWPVQTTPPELPHAHSLADLNGHARRRESATSRSPLTIGSLQSNSSIEIPSMARSQSYTMLDSNKNLNRKLSGGVLPAGLLSSSTASTSRIDATGTILDQSGISAIPEPKMIEKRPTHHSIPIEPKRSILDARFTPTPPTQSISVPLGRTKSQLTLLLEREKARERGELGPDI
ncbi:hypothetical protein B0T10DRAFT_241579 [Thelonectria olida]|uniref:Nitrogen regulatory protein areA GATA-like domain-containing protein n=1 Tax=Thelonectria olida TaxID=1576542 RepID=A0A9P9ASS0_9HYPO|nr:hypothetical protein B0T10DRAFT_241579 [Thelonectria olida]